MPVLILTQPVQLQVVQWLRLDASQDLTAANPTAFRKLTVVVRIKKAVHLIRQYAPIRLVRQLQIHVFSAALKDVRHVTMYLLRRVFYVELATQDFTFLQ